MFSYYPDRYYLYILFMVEGTRSAHRCLVSTHLKPNLKTETLRKLKELIQIESAFLAKIDFIKKLIAFCMGPCLTYREASWLLLVSVCFSFDWSWIIRYEHELEHSQLEFSSSVRYTSNAKLTRSIGPRGDKKLLDLVAANVNPFPFKFVVKECGLW